jgi:uncharacterized membrane protein
MSAPSLAELKKRRTPIRNVNTEHKERLTRLERFAIWITDHVGTMGFFIIIFIWTFSWLIWNSFGPKSLRFDPFPSFVFWLFISNMIQIFLMPLIMIGQNLQGRHAEARAESDYEVNIKAERETEAILMHLEEQGRMLSEIAKKVDARG